MSEHKELQVVFNDSAIALPGWRFTPTAAVVEVKSAETFKNAFRFLHSTTGYNAWWWGDVILAYCEWEKAGKGEDAAYVHYARDWEEIVGLSAGTIQTYCMVSRAIKATSRLVTLSWSHHHEVVGAGVKDEHEMADWLRLAVENKWSKTQLRAALRAAKNTPSDDASQPVKITQQELFAAKRWSRVQMSRVDDMAQDEAERMLADLEPILQLAAALARRVGGKESLSAA